jgi:hypothetical protein
MRAGEHYPDAPVLRQTRVHIFPKHHARQVGRFNLTMLQAGALISKMVPPWETMPQTQCTTGSGAKPRLLHERQHDQDDQQDHQEGDQCQLRGGARGLDDIPHLLLSCSEAVGGVVHLLVHLCKHGLLLPELLLDRNTHLPQPRHRLLNVPQVGILLPATVTSM